jgi:hypothetical protein
VSVCVVGVVLLAGGLGAGCSGDDGGDGDPGDAATTAGTGSGTTAAAGGDGGAAGSLSLAGLAGADDACPLDLGAAVEGAGLTPGDGATVRVDAGSGEGGAVAAFGGTYVECVQPVEGGEVTATVLATEQAGAFNLLLPQVMQDLDQSFDEAEGLAARAEGVAPGELIDLGPGTPVAAGVLAVEGAGSAILYVDAADSPRPEQAQSIATRLLDQA